MAQTGSRGQERRVDKGERRRGGGGGGGDSLEERGGDGQRRLDFISSCPFDVRDACCWPASAFLTNSSPRRPLISALCPLLSTFLSFSSSLRRELFPCAAQGAGGRGRATYVCKYAGMRARVRVRESFALSPQRRWVCEWVGVYIDVLSSPVSLYNCKYPSTRITCHLWGGRFW